MKKQVGYKTVLRQCEKKINEQQAIISSYMYVCWVLIKKPQSLLANEFRANIDIDKPFAELATLFETEFTKQEKELENNSND